MPKKAVFQRTASMVKTEHSTAKRTGGKQPAKVSTPIKAEKKPRPDEL